MTPKEKILKYLEEKTSAPAKELGDVLGVSSRQAVNKHLRKLVENGRVTKMGTTRGTIYALAEKSDSVLAPFPRIYRKEYALAKIQEDRVFGEIELFLNLKKYLNANAYKIARYAFTEMLNNAIEHSQSETCKVEVTVDPSRYTFRVRDYGLGIFYTIYKKFGLEDEASAIGELLKGKTTTMPERHTGEGVFFTSKSGDAVSLRSHQIDLRFDNRKDDIFVEERKFVKGTEVSFSVSAQTKRKLENVFGRYAPEEFDYRFDKTRVYVKLFAKQYVSRSEAKRLLSGLEKFREIVLDFKGVRSIGQGFADEIFRIFRESHPNIAVTAQNVSPALRPIISHVTVDNKTPIVG